MLILVKRELKSMPISLMCTCFHLLQRQSDGSKTKETMSQRSGPFAGSLPRWPADKPGLGRTIAKLPELHVGHQSMWVAGVQALGPTSAALGRKLDQKTE